MFSLYGALLLFAVTFMVNLCVLSFSSIVHIHSASIVYIPHSDTTPHRLDFAFISYAY
jgi:hypothetical protein